MSNTITVTEIAEFIYAVPTADLLTVRQDVSNLIVR